MSKKLIIIIVVIIILLVAAYFIYKKVKDKKEEAVKTEDDAKAQISGLPNKENLGTTIIGTGTVVPTSMPILEMQEAEFNGFDNSEYEAWYNSLTAEEKEGVDFVNAAGGYPLDTSMGGPVAAIRNAWNSMVIQKGWDKYLAK